MSNAAIKLYNSYIVERFEQDLKFLTFVQDRHVTLEFLINTLAKFAIDNHIDDNQITEKLKNKISEKKHA